MQALPRLVREDIASAGTTAVEWLRGGPVIGFGLVNAVHEGSIWPGRACRFTEDGALFTDGSSEISGPFRLSYRQSAIQHFPYLEGQRRWRKRFRQEGDTFIRHTVIAH